jgi:hypothetical protein
MQVLPMEIKMLLLSLVFVAFGGSFSTILFSGDPGFQEAVFDANSIRDMLDQNNCDGIRVYNTLNNGKVELMAIATSKGADMNEGWFNFSPYLVSQGIVDGRIKTDRISDSKARKRCEEIYNSSFHQYAVDFSRNEIESLLENRGANAVRITPSQSGEALSMEMEAVNFESGTIQGLANGGTAEATNPCPPYCGVSGNYIFTP